MQHGHVRRLMPALLAGAPLPAARAALATACLTRGHSDGVAAALLDRASALAPVARGAYRGPLGGQPLPDNAAGLATQLAPAAIAHPQDPGVCHEGLLALCELWPHATVPERLTLRSAWLDAIACAPAEPASFVTSLQLRAWQKELPTSFGTAPPSVVGMRGIVNAPTPLAAYQCLCEHFGGGLAQPNGFAVLVRTLGSLVVQVLLQRRDPHAKVAGLLAAAAALERLAAWTPPELMATLAAQFAHRLWWTWRQAGLQALVACLDDTSTFPVRAISAGDVTLAQRAARMAVRRGAWPEAESAVVAAALDDPGPRWELTVRLLDAVSFRGPGGSALPEDAAAVCGACAGWAWSATVPR